MLLIGVQDFKTPMKNWNKHNTGVFKGEPYDFITDWVLWHLVEHDIHHRAQLKLQYSFLNNKIDEDIFWEEK